MNAVYLRNFAICVFLHANIGCIWYTSVNKTIMYMFLKVHTTGSLVHFGATPHTTTHYKFILMK